MANQFNQKTTRATILRLGSKLIDPKAAQEEKHQALNSLKRLARRDDSTANLIVDELMDMAREMPEAKNGAQRKGVIVAGMAVRKEFADIIHEAIFPTGQKHDSKIA